jgi:hypothetical protein
MTSFVSAPIQPAGDALVTPAADGEPPLPAAFIWKAETLAVATLLRTWRSTKDDRGDTYLKRHWFEFETPDGSRAVVYFDRGAKRGAARWWLYTITRSSAP